MLEFLISNGWAMYLGGALALAGINLKSWKFYAIIIPVCILVAISKQK